MRAKNAKSAPSARPPARPPALARLPALDLLRGFVAVGRRMSVTLAAQDLFLTQSAVSRQVAALEAAIGVPLLQRHHRAITFTPAGRQLFDTADAALNAIAHCVQQVRQAGAERPVTISASVGVTGLWLLPRLTQLQAALPDVEVRLSADNRLNDLRREDIDLAIRYCPAPDAPADAEPLFGETIAPVAHPDLALAALNSGRSLRGVHLLELDDAAHPQLGWQHWLAQRGLAGARPAGVLHFNQYDQVIQAALAGQGVALGRLELLRRQRDQGLLRIIPAKASPAPLAHAYWLLHAAQAPRPAVTRVAQWIREQAAAGREAGEAGQTA